MRKKVGTNSSSKMVVIRKQSNKMKMAGDVNHEPCITTVMHDKLMKNQIKHTSTVVSQTCNAWQTNRQTDNLF